MADVWDFHCGCRWLWFDNGRQFEYERTCHVHDLRMQPDPTVSYFFQWPPGANAETAETSPTCPHKDITEEEAVLLLRDNYGGSFQTLYERMRRHGYLIVKIG